MRVLCLAIVVLLASTILVCNFEALNSKEDSIQIYSEPDFQQNTISEDFYFVHITDTHIMHNFFDRNEISKERLKSVLNRVCSFENKPAFIVITGDLTEWGGSRISGVLNCQAFVSCLYNNGGQFYVDANYSIPVYTTPGNHDYCFSRNINNYLKYIKREEQYIINYKDISLFFINSGSNYYSEPNDWLDLDGNGLCNCTIEWLNDSLNNCSSRHKIILMHHPAINKRNKQGEMTDVIAYNREKFIELCESFNIELVLTGHTHDSIVFNSNEKIFDELPINCSQFSTLFVQSDDCKQGLHYRNVTISGNDVWLEKSEELNAYTENFREKNNLQYYTFQNIF
jgi:predicted MPP superfamily phosphohydrolase